VWKKSPQGKDRQGGDYEQGVFLRTFKTVNSDDSDDEDDDGRSTSGLRRKIGGD